MSAVPPEAPPARGGARDSAGRAAGRGRLDRGHAAMLVTAVVLLVANWAFALRNVRAVAAGNAWVKHTQQVVIASQSLLAGLAESAAEARAPGVGGAPLPVLDQRVAARVDELQRLTGDDPQQRARIDTLRAAIAAWRARPTDPALRAVRATVADVEAEEARLLAVRERTVSRRYRESVQSSVLALLASLGLVAAAALLLRRYAAARDRLGQERRRSAREREELTQYNRLLLDSTAEGIYGIDLAGTCTFLNAAAARLLGLDPAAALGRNMHALTHHTHADGSPYPADECPIYHVLRDGVGVQREDDVFWRQDGSSFPTDFSAFPVRSGGALAGAVVTFSDITVRKRTEEQLTRLSLVASKTENAVIITDRDQRIEWVNDGFTRLTGYTLEDAVGRNPGRLLQGPRSDRATAARIGECLRRREGVTEEIVNYTRAGVPYWVSLAITPILDAAGDVVRFIAIEADVTTRKEAEEELARAKVAADAANDAKSQFLANMSHELRTPLNAVILYSELLQEEAEDRGVAEFVPDLEKIRRAGHHLLALVNGVLDLSKIEAGKMELDVETFDVRQLVDDVRATTTPLLAKQANTLAVRVADDVTTMHADATKVRQILLNLLSNAVKFTDRGTIALDVAREAAADGEWIVVRVRDTGVGMTPEQLDRLFQPFTQADETITRRFGGTGLGLAICARFAELMGGTVAAASEPGAGSEFTVRLPRYVRSQDAAPAAGAGAAPVVDGAALVIDDDPAARSFVTGTLARLGIPTVAAASGEDGLQLAASFRPSIVFLDVVLPRMDGWAVLAALKAMPALDDVPIVMLTMAPGQDLGYLLGATEYLIKPVEQRRLLDLVGRHVPRRDAGSVLVVDDDATTRQVVRKVLEREGWQVEEAEHGRVALGRLAAGRVALVILDLIMPEMDGFAFLDALRRQEAWRTVPVVLMTSKDLTQADRARLAGRVETIIQKGAHGRDDVVADIIGVVRRHAIAPGAAGAAAPQAPESRSE